MYYLHWITRRLCSVRHPSAGCYKCLTFCTFEIWEIWHFCIKVSNITTNFVVKICKYKYWITFCQCSRAIWIASERTANVHAPLTWCIQFAIISLAIHMARENWQNVIQCLNDAMTKHLYMYSHVNVTQAWDNYLQSGKPSTMATARWHRSTHCVAVFISKPSSVGVQILICIKNTIHFTWEYDTCHMGTWYISHDSMIHWHLSTHCVAVFISKPITKEHDSALTNI